MQKLHKEPRISVVVVIVCKSNLNNVHSNSMAILNAVAAQSEAIVRYV